MILFKRRNQHGFSLFEILTVAALLVLLGTLLVPRVFRSNDFLTLRFTAEEIANEIRLAQNLAQTEGRNIRLIFYANRLNMIYFSSPGTLVRPELYLPPGVMIKAAGDPELGFNSLGGVYGPTENAGWHITLICGSERLYVVVAVNSGRVSVRDRLE